MAHALYLVTIEVDPKIEAEWNEWQEKVHLPEILREPGFVHVRRWKDVTKTDYGFSIYQVHFELESLEAYHRYDRSETARRVRDDSLSRWGASQRLRRAVLELRADLLPKK